MDFVEIPFSLKALKFNLAKAELLNFNSYYLQFFFKCQLMAILDL
jgi:hypothetical protein